MEVSESSLFKVAFPYEIVASYRISQLSFGAFSNVFLIQSNSSKILYIIKFIPRTLHPERILSEIKILYRLRFEFDVNCQLLKVFKEDGHYFLKMNYIENGSLSNMYQFRTVDLKIFLYKSLKALACLFHHGIIHWDIKQTNILYNSVLGLFSLIDFGLAHEAQYRGSLQSMLEDFDSLKNLPKLELNEKRECDPSLFNIHSFEKTGTVGFCAPEILIESFLLSDRIDVWSLGVVLVSVLCGRGVFFRGNWLCNIEDEKMVDVIELTYVFGTDKVVSWLRENVNISRKAKLYLEKMGRLKYRSAKSLKAICLNLNRVNPEICSNRIPDSLWDLLEKMLELDARKRISAPQLLEHPFFQKS